MRYIRHSPPIRRVLVRAGVAMFFTSALFALLPTVARGVSNSAIGYGLLLGCFGAGAVLGALLLQPIRSRWSTEAVVSAGVITVGTVIMTTSALHRLSTLGLAMLIGGGAWITFISLINALVQNLAPDWVRARVLAVFMLVFQGSLALGSATWGAVAQRAGIHTALMYAGVGTIGTIMLTVFARLPNAPADLSPWNHWRAPAVVKEVESELERGPMLVTVEYVVLREQRDEFVEAMHEYGRTRRRDGASRWGIFHDTEDGDRYLEIFVVNSWAEHLRQHDRQTQADRELEERLRRYLVNDPVVRHLIVAQSKNRI